MLLRRFLRGGGAQILTRASAEVPRRVVRSCRVVGFKGKQGSQNGSPKGFCWRVRPPRRVPYCSVCVLQAAKKPVLEALSALVQLGA